MDNYTTDEIFLLLSLAEEAQKHVVTGSIDKLVSKLDKEYSRRVEQECDSYTNEEITHMNNSYEEEQLSVMRGNT